MAIGAGGGVSRAKRGSQIFKRLYFISWFTLAALIINPLSAQLPAAAEITLSDGTALQLFREAGQSPTSTLYYYLPVNLRISDADGYSEFSFIVFRNDSLSPIRGGIMHLLLVWGLTPAQQTEAERLLLSKTDSSAVIGGSLFMDEDPTHPPGFEILSDSPLAHILRRSLKNAGGTPLNAGAKIAAAFSFSAEDAAEMNDALNQASNFDGIRFKMYFKLNNAPYTHRAPQSWTLEGDFGQWLRHLKK